jgi:hypothetical protein
VEQAGGAAERGAQADEAGQAGGLDAVMQQIMAGIMGIIKMIDGLQENLQGGEGGPLAGIGRAINDTVGEFLGTLTGGIGDVAGNVLKDVVGGITDIF